jgi:hypothetical protein
MKYKEKEKLNSGMILLNQILKLHLSKIWNSLKINYILSKHRQRTKEKTETRLKANKMQREKIGFCIFQLVDKLEKKKNIAFLKMKLHKLKIQRQENLEEELSLKFSIENFEKKGNKTIINYTSIGTGSPNLYNRTGQYSKIFKKLNKIFLQRKSTSFKILKKQAKYSRITGLFLSSLSNTRISPETGSRVEDVCQVLNFMKQKELSSNSNSDSSKYKSGSGSQNYSLFAKNDKLFKITPFRPHSLTRGLNMLFQYEKELKVCSFE